MKMTSRKVLVLVLWACYLSISSADDTVVPDTNQVTQPGGQATNKTNDSVPSMKDMQKAADPSFDASELEAPVRLALSIMKNGLKYGVYTPLSLSIKVLLEPFILSYYVISAPIRFFLGPVINPVTGFIGREITKTENLALWTALESISYGSGATAKSVSEGMQLALKGILQSFTDIGLPIANTAEKLSKLTDHMAKSRSRRAIADAAGTSGYGIAYVIFFPFLVVWAALKFAGFMLFHALLLPFYIIYYVFYFLTWPFRFIFGGRNSTYTLLLTDMSAERITRMVLTSVWKFMRDTGFSKLNDFAIKLKDNPAVPNQFRMLLSEYATIYRIMKMLNYVK